MLEVSSVVMQDQVITDRFSMLEVAVKTGRPGMMTGLEDLGIRKEDGRAAQGRRRMLSTIMETIVGEGKWFLKIRIETFIILN